MSGRFFVPVINIKPSNNAVLTNSPKNKSVVNTQSKNQSITPVHNFTYIENRTILKGQSIPWGLNWLITYPTQLDFQGARL